MFNIFSIPAFNDNYIWTIVKDNNVIVVHPGNSFPVIKTSKKKKSNSMSEVFGTIRSWKDNF